MPVGEEQGQYHTLLIAERGLRVKYNNRNQTDMDVKREEYLQGRKRV